MFGGRAQELFELGQRVVVPGDVPATGRPPQHDAQMVTAHRIADRGGDGLGVGVIAGQDFPHPQGSGAVAVGEPAVALVLVHTDDLLRDPVDVPERHRRQPLEERQAGLRREAGAVDLFARDVEHQRMTDAVRAREGVHRHAALREPARVLEGRGRRFDVLQRYVVAQRVEDGLDVPADAGAQQLDDLGVAPQFGDIAGQAVPNGAGHLSLAGDEAGHDRGVGLADRRIHVPTVEPDFVPSVQIGGQS